MVGTNLRPRDVIVYSATEWLVLSRAHTRYHLSRHHGPFPVSFSILVFSFPSFLLFMISLRLVFRFIIPSVWSYVRVI